MHVRGRRAAVQHIARPQWPAQMPTEARREKRAAAVHDRWHRQPTLYGQPTSATRVCLLQCQRLPFSQHQRFVPSNRPATATHCFKRRARQRHHPACGKPQGRPRQRDLQSGRPCVIPDQTVRCRQRLRVRRPTGWHAKRTQARSPLIHHQIAQAGLQHFNHGEQSAPDRPASSMLAPCAVDQTGRPPSGR